MQQFVFVPFGRMVLASRVQAGFAFGKDPLAYTDRFRAGGGTSVRGYGEESLGPRDFNGLPSGGDRLLILNQEMRFPMYRWANGVAFVDAGNIFAKGEDWNGLKMGYGFGLRFDTPVGLLRGDLGIPTDKARRAQEYPVLLRIRTHLLSLTGTASPVGRQIPSGGAFPPGTALPSSLLNRSKNRDDRRRSGASGARRRNASKCSAVFGSWRWR